MEAHWHYTILAANNLVNGQYIESAQIIVIADTEEDAIEKSKKAIYKLIYVVIAAQECVEVHGVQSDMSMLQLEIQKKLLDLSKGRN